MPAIPSSTAGGFPPIRNPNTSQPRCSISTTPTARSPTASPRSRPSTPPASTSSPSTTAASAASAGAHPTERLATDDAIAAWTYLTDTRHIPPSHLIVFGDGVGATFAAHLAAQFAPAGVILEDPNPPARQILLSDARARILPLWLLQNERLDPTADLASSHIPRLFLDVRGDPEVSTVHGSGVVAPHSTRTRALFDASSYPKQYFDLRAFPETSPEASPIPPSPPRSPASTTTSSTNHSRRGKNTPNPAPRPGSPHSKKLRLAASATRRTKCPTSTP